MKRTRIIKEEKYFKISSGTLHIIGHGFSFTNEGKVYYEESFVSEEDRKAKMALANEEWKTMCAKPKEPKLEIYWKGLEETIQMEIEN